MSTPTSIQMSTPVQMSTPASVHTTQTTARIVSPSSATSGTITSRAATPTGGKIVSPGVVATHVPQRSRSGKEIEQVPIMVSSATTATSSGDALNAQFAAIAGRDSSQK